MARTPWRATIIGACVGLVVAVCAFGLYATLRAQDRASAEIANRRAAGEAARLVEERIRETFIALKAVRAAISESIARGGHFVSGAFHRAIEQSGALTEYPQLRAIGLSLLIDKKDVAATKKRLDGTLSRRILGYPPIDIQTDADGHKVLPIIARVPNKSIGRAHGFNLLSDPKRITAIFRARDTGAGEVTGRVTLANGRAGVIMMLPIYQGGKTPRVLQARREKFAGLLTTVFQTGEFLLNIEEAFQSLALDYEVHDLGGSTRIVTPPLGPDTVLTSSRLTDAADAASNADKLLAHTTDRIITRDISVGDRTWRLLVNPKPSVPAARSAHVAIGVLALGLLIALLGGMFTRQTLAQSVRLRQHVAERTEELQRSRDALQSSANALRAANSKINYHAAHDALTGLKNRSGLQEALSKLIVTSRHLDTNLAVLHLGLDRFKQINETLGHACGDHVLRHIAKLMSETLNDDVIIGRMGGDEFIAVFSGNLGASDIREQATKLLKLCNQPTEYQGRHCRFGASIGIAYCIDPSMGAQELLVNADVALNHAKARGRNRYEEFNSKLSSALLAKKALADDILRGLDAQEFFAVYQPQICAQTGQLAGIEALARWRHPDKGVLAPAAFLETAYDLGVVARLDRTILTDAIATVRRAESQGFEIPKLNVNLSFERLDEPDFRLSLSDLPSMQARLSFEILEAVFLDDDRAPALMNIDYIKECGHDVEIDDFGSGRASVIALTKINPTRVKIDRQLIAPITENESRRRLAHSLIDTGKALDISVTAEGVETAEHVALLREMGCDIFQGYHFAAPMEEAKLLDFVHELQSGARAANF